MSDAVVYLDSSALIKLIFEEPESTALTSFLGAWPLRVTSSLTCIEVTRVVAHVDDPLVDREAQRVLRGVSLIRMDDGIVAAAAKVGPPGLRSLDAIHLATAQSLGHHLAGMVVYDRRLADAARGCGINIWAPGHEAVPPRRVKPPVTGDNLHD